MQQESSKSASSNSSRKSNTIEKANMIFTYMMGEEQPFEMKIIEPRDLTIEEKIEMNS